MPGRLLIGITPPSFWACKPNSIIPRATGAPPAALPGGARAPCAERDHGETILVYADAEIVIEGWLPTNRLEADGPFGGYTGYMGPQVSAPVCEVSCITRRRNAIYHD